MSEEPNKQKPFVEYLGVGVEGMASLLEDFIEFKQTIFLSQDNSEIKQNPN